MKTERAVSITSNIETTQERSRKTISQSTLDVMFWMLEESCSASLELQGKKILMTHFDSLEEAIKYRSELEAEQFTLSHLFTKFPHSLDLEELQ